MPPRVFSRRGPYPIPLLDSKGRPHGEITSSTDRAEISYS